MCAEVSINIRGASYVSAQQQVWLVWANHQKDGCSKQRIIKVAEVVQECWITLGLGVEVTWHRFLKDPCQQSDRSQTFMAHMQPFRSFGMGAPPLLFSVPSPTPQIYDRSLFRQEAARRESSSLIPSPSSLIFICIFIKDADYRVITARLPLA